MVSVMKLTMLGCEISKSTDLKLAVKSVVRATFASMATARQMRSAVENRRI